MSAAGLTAGVKSLYISGIYSDLTLICGDQSFKVHKNNLHLQSPHFRRMLSGKFQEASENTITLYEDSPAHMATLLHSIYHFTYSDSPRTETATSPIESSHRTHTRHHLYATWAATKLRNTFHPHFDNVPSIIATVRLTESNTADEILWEIVIPKLAENMSWLVDDEGFFAALQEIPGFQGVEGDGQVERGV